MLLFSRLMSCEVLLLGECIIVVKSLVSGVWCSFVKWVVMMLGWNELMCSVGLCCVSFLVSMVLVCFVVL